LIRFKNFEHGPAGALSLWIRSQRWKVACSPGPEQKPHLSGYKYLSAVYRQGVKIKLSLCMPWKHTRGAQVQFYSFFTAAQDGGEWSTSCPGCLNPGKNPSTHWIRGWVSPMDSLDDLENRKISWPCQQALPLLLA
jgi:hypothetical protein